MKDLAVERRLMGGGVVAGPPKYKQEDGSKVESASLVVLGDALYLFAGSRRASCKILKTRFHFMAAQRRNTKKVIR